MPRARILPTIKRILTLSGPLPTRRQIAATDEAPLPLSYAVFGAGSAARSHVREIGRQPGVTLIGIADPADPALWRIGSDIAAAARFGDAGELLRNLRPDLVSICTPPKFHHSLTKLALRAGAHIVCEKPMAITLAEAEEMEAERLAYGKIGAINFSCRNVPAFRWARALIGSGDLGSVTRVAATYLQSFRASSTARWNWRSDAAIAGFGALGDLGVHMIDSVRFVTSREFRRVAGAMQTRLPHQFDRTGLRRVVTTETNAVFLAELEGGVLATFEASQVAAGYADFLRIEVSGARGTLTVQREHPHGLWLTRLARGRTREVWRPMPRRLKGSNTPTSLGAVISAIRGVPAPYVTFADGLAAQRVLDALAAAANSGMWVELANSSPGRQHQVQ
jgi:predicted dehydrogenase